MQQFLVDDLTIEVDTDSERLRLVDKEGQEVVPGSSYISRSEEHWDQYIHNHSSSSSFTIWTIVGRLRDREPDQYRKLLALLSAPLTTRLEGLAKQFFETHKEPYAPIWLEQAGAVLCGQGGGTQDWKFSDGSLFKLQPTPDSANLLASKY